MSRIVRTSSLILIAAALTGCDLAPAPEGKARDAVDAQAAADPATPSAAEAQTPPAAAPKPTDGYDWYSRVNDETRSRSMVLAYEVPETDDQPLSFTCEEGGRRVFVNRDSGTRGVKALEVTSGAALGLYRIGETTESELSGGEYLTAEIPWNDPVLRAFAQTGWLRLATPDGSVDMAVQGEAGKTRIREFLDFCGEA